MPINKNKRNEMKENSAHKMSKMIKKMETRTNTNQSIIYYILFLIWNHRMHA